MGLLMIVNALFNGFLLFRYPEYEDVQRTDAQSEIKDFLAQHPAFAKSFFDSSLKVGADIVKSNPGARAVSFTARGEPY